MSLELDTLFERFSTDPRLVELVTAGRFDEALARLRMRRRRRSRTSSS